MSRRRKKQVKKKESSTIESKVSKILQSMNVEYEQQVSIDRYKVDFLINKKYVVECYGDFWHCNPHQYTSSYFNRGKKKTAEEIWSHDAERKKKFEELGYRFMCLWENEINNNPHVVRSKLKHIIKIVDKLKDS